MGFWALNEVTVKDSYSLLKIDGLEAGGAAAAEEGQPRVQPQEVIALPECRTYHWLENSHDLLGDKEL